MGGGFQGSRSDWKTSEKWEGIFQIGKVWENHTKYCKSQEISEKCYLLFLVILKLIKFSVKKTGKWKKSRKSQGILSVRKSGNHGLYGGFIVTCIVVGRYPITQHSGYQYRTNHGRGILQRQVG